MERVFTRVYSSGISVSDANRLIVIAARSPNLMNVLDALPENVEASCWGALLQFAESVEELNLEVKALKKTIVLKENTISDLLKTNNGESQLKGKIPKGVALLNELKALKSFFIVKKKLFDDIMEQSFPVDVSSVTTNIKVVLESCDKFLKYLFLDDNLQFADVIKKHENEYLNICKMYEKSINSQLEILNINICYLQTQNVATNTSSNMNSDRKVRFLEIEK